jgi:hypothetical protein
MKPCEADISSVTPASNNPGNNAIKPTIRLISPARIRNIPDAYMILITSSYSYFMYSNNSHPVKSSYNNVVCRLCAT